MFNAMPTSNLTSPRPLPRSPTSAAEVRVRNRRREYLARHLSYLSNPEHELADPLRYDALVRRFQSADERAAEGRARGYGRVLEGSLERGEARLARLSAAGRPAAGAEDELEGVLMATSSEVESRAEGLARWEEFLRERFITGGDGEFEYEKVDRDEELDVVERREREEAWFEDEEPGWASGVGDEDEEREGNGGHGEARKQEGGESDERVKNGTRKESKASRRPDRVLFGETGVQDF